MSQDRDLRRLKTLEALAAEQAGTPEGELSAQRAQESRARLGLPPPRETPPPPRPGSGGGPKRKPGGGGKPKRKPKVTLTPEGAALAAMVMFGLGLFVLGGEYSFRRDDPDEDEEGRDKSREGTPNGP